MSRILGRIAWRRIHTCVARNIKIPGLSIRYQTIRMKNSVRLIGNAASNKGGKPENVAPDYTPYRPDGYYSDVIVVRGLPLVVRRATPADHDVILSMDTAAGAYDAGDYLVGKLRSYLDDKEKLNWVAVLDTKIIGYLMSHYSDGGHHVVGRLARVEQEYRGEGIWEALRYIGNVDQMGMWPRARMYLGCSSSFHLPYFQVSHKWKEILARPYVTTSLTKSEKIRVPDNPIMCKSLSQPDLENYLQDPALSVNLFPKSALLIGREPFLIHPINFERMAKEYDTALVSFTDTHDTERITGISFGTGIPGKDCYTYDCAVYCNSNNPLEFSSHIQSHLPLVQQISTFNAITMHTFAQFKQEGEYVVNAFKLIDQHNKNDRFCNGNSLELKTHTFGSLPLKSYLYTSWLTLQNVGKKNGDDSKL